MATAAEIIASAKSKLGAPYVFGDEGPSTFDCSGLIQWAFGQHGIQLPRTTYEQYKVGTTVPKGQEQPGDLIFSNWDGDTRGPSHVAMYLGNGQYINAPQPGDVVKIGTLNPGYWAHVTNVQRVPGVDGSPAGPHVITAGLPSPSDFTGAVRSAAGALQSMAGGVEAIGNLASKLIWFTLPTTQIRLVTGGLGIGFLLVGVWLLAREVRSD